MNAKPVALIAPDDHAELVSFLPIPRKPQRPNIPYLKSFQHEKPERIVRGSKLLYTACSTKSWPAPTGELV